MSEDLEIITLAALLHDLGKVKQRMEKRGAHYEHSANLVKSKSFSTFLKEAFGLGNEEINKIADLVRRHHENISSVRKRKDYDLMLLKKADGLSSGLDREYFEDYEEKAGNISDPIISVFSEISYETKVLTPEELNSLLRYEVKALSPESAYPKSKEEVEVEADDYKEIWGKFIEECKKIPPLQNSSFSQNLDALKSLITKYFWSVPSYTYHHRKLPIPDVPLTDHLSTTAAIATALKIYHEEIGYENVFEQTEEEKFILLSCDFSGIQSFIFQEIKDTKKFGAKLLRARSLGVSLAIENVINEIISAFKGNSSLVLFNAGGKAWLLLPNLSNSDELLKNLKEKISRKLLKNFYGEIKLKFAYIKLKEQELQKENYQEKIKELFKEEQKQRFKLLDKWIFSKNTAAQKQFLENFSDEESLCPICKLRKREKDYGEEEKVCSVCYMFLKIGEKIPKLSTKTNDEKEEKKIICFKKSENLWPMFELYNEKDKEKANACYCYSFSYNNFNGFPVKPMANHIPLINKKELEKEDWKLQAIKNLCFSSEKDFNKQVKDGNPKTFCHIGIDSLYTEGDTIYGRPYLGVLKADVDALGYIFSNGFCKIKDIKKGEKKEFSLYSLSRIVYLSRMIDYFFSQILPEKILKEEKFKNIYSVFAGGDDLFLIGDWYSITLLAQKIKEEFGKFTGGGIQTEGPSLTISIGIHFFDHHTPVYQIAELGESALKKAKETVITNKKGGKEIIRRGNSIVILNQSIRGHKKESLKKLLEIAEVLELLLKEDVLTTSTLYKIMDISWMANRAIENPRNLLWRPLVYYLITRNAKLQKEKEEQFKEVLNLNWEDEKEFKENLAKRFIKWIEKYSENLSEEEKKEKDNLFYIPLVIALYRRRRYGKAKLPAT
ncbi:CRISPR-associated protein Cas10/Csm1, subtype III-A/MTUBE [Desulfurobacterium pacificum]|uniref:CRISPR system single-strand-specific deoxyribonuclease Cas10/Csm1 (subtype III-A) n=1 Tax=Desulfurobacterium pacificum TaxID=240166 RepID=A0ABY1NAW0_9BACT|nr:type III-A CRISPR-associated protein Cas10/Csm1 [Desulfurobacterium pacificum]SMP05061.1 CRISPR-associated protein Cas10/Csm1, subtype III-A/MTUBE [Desulfurobacterium pacificum]